MIPIDKHAILLTFCGIRAERGAYYMLPLSCYRSREFSGIESHGKLVNGDHQRDPFKFRTGVWKSGRL